MPRTTSRAARSRRGIRPQLPATPEEDPVPGRAPDEGEAGGPAISAWKASLIAAVAVFLIGFATSSSAQISEGDEITDADCTLCHDGSESDIPLGDHSELLGGPHESVRCVDCHVDVLEVPHEDELQAAACVNCHQSVAAEYTTHGMGIVGRTPDLPTCSSCHGGHDILPASDPRSRTNPDNQSKECATCHSDLNLAREHDIGLKRVVEMYDASVHGTAHAAGDELAPLCTDCHGVQGNPHRILGPGNSASSVNHFNVPETCGRCHGAIMDEYHTGIHGALMLRGETHVPVCTDCHGEHGILRTDDPRATVSPARVAEATCTPCHESARINESYNLPAGTEVSYVDSYHGLKSRSGDVTVANCASCHGSHRILRARNPASRVHPSNLQTTCGECHPAMSAEVAQVPIHSARQESKWVGLVTRIYILLIVGVIGGMFGYVALDYRHHFAQQLKKRPQVVRMPPLAVIQHALLATTFIVLVITGFALRYSDLAFFRFLFGWDGGFDSRGIIHRVAAVLFMATCVWHLVYLFGRTGKAFLKGMSPGMRDVREFIEAMQFNLGKRGSPPKFGRFSFVEKAEYWALVWGTVVMVATGLALWFRNETVEAFSREFVAVSRVIHLYEAWLATLAILIWHFYAVIFKPGVFPGNPAWLRGKMPAEMYEEEHPGEDVEALIEEGEKER